MTRRKGQRGYVERKGDTWFGRYWVDIPGQEKRQHVSVRLGSCSELTYPQACHRLLDFLMEQGINSPQTFARITGSGESFEHRAEWWKVNKLSQCSTSYRTTRERVLQKHLMPYFAGKSVSAITEKEAQEFVASLSREKGLAPATVQTIVGTLRAVLGKRHIRDWLLTLPRLPDTEQRYFTVAEMQAIVQQAIGKWKAFFATLAETGVRYSECAALHIEDVDLLNHKIIVRRSVYLGKEQPTKTRAGVRDVYIASNLAHMLQEHIGSRASGLVFQSRNSSPIRESQALKVLHRILDSLGFKRGGLHAFRHGRVSQLQQSGVPADLIREEIGHSTLRTTSHYTHFGDDFRRGLAEKLYESTKVLPVSVGA